MSGMQENRKKTKKIFQLCRVPALGKAGHFSQQSPALPSAGVVLGKVTKPLPSASTRQRIFQKKCRVPDTSALGKGWRQVDGARYLCRELVWHSANSLPSACHVALGKDSFADHFFAEWALPRAALGKAFADGKGSFAECGQHSAKAVDPVVILKISTPHSR